MNTGPTGLRDLRTQEIRKHLTEVALRLFDDNGYDAVSVDNIAAIAGVSQRTFFRYFQSKDDLVLQYERSLHARLLAALAQRPPEEGPVTALRSAYLETATTTAGHRARIRRRGQLLAASPALRSRASGERTAGVDDITGVLALRRSGTDPGEYEWQLRVIATALSAVAAEAWTRWVFHGGDTDPADQLAEAFSLLTSGWDLLDE
ncbi:TetR family transcriptional regulator [Nocardia flavorosea]|uniref:TetR family transcriptional regulator n=1 Tax=Nocardia flavorosea TaxID=53429 RepID=UPI0007A4B4AD|nr:TetR family transcriptional regulator [Nocardia flavorosea]